MDINLILQGKKCSCGKTHTCPIEHVYIEHNAITRLRELCAPYGKILAVADENTYAAAGAAVEAALGKRDIRRVIFDGSQVLIPNEAAIAAVEELIPDIELILGIGSGVIQDLCKYVSHVHNIPYMIVATAPSMDGYASDGAAMILGGMKKTVPATLPKAIIADTDVLSRAPLDMIKAGFGDIIGKYSALCDWRLSNAVLGEYFCDYIYDTTSEMIEKTLACAEGLMKRDEESVGTLAQALVVVGIMMSFATTSRPASGSEHHLSHYFEISGIIENTPYFTHGIDVAYSTVVTAELREGILSRPFPDVQFTPDADKYRNEMKDAYQSREVLEGCIALQEKAGLYGKDRLSCYKEKEALIRSILSDAPTSKSIEEMLALVKLDMKDFYTLYSSEKINRAIRYAKDLKNRYTVLWMNYDLGYSS